MDLARTIGLTALSTVAFAAIGVLVTGSPYGVILGIPPAALGTLRAWRHRGHDQLF